MTVPGSCARQDLAPSKRAAEPECASLGTLWNRWVDYGLLRQPFLESSAELIHTFLLGSWISRGRSSPSHAFCRQHGSFSPCARPFPPPKWLFPWLPMGVWGWWLPDLSYGCCILLAAPHHPSPASALALRPAHRSWLEGLFVAHCLPCQTTTQPHMLQVPALGAQTCALSPSLYRPNTASLGQDPQHGGAEISTGAPRLPCAPFPVSSTATDALTCSGFQFAFQ